jgi:hypothetical protein
MDLANPSSLLAAPSSGADDHAKQPALFPGACFVSFLVGPENLAFLDGYLFRAMVDMLRTEGAEASGMYEFYKARVEVIGTALSDYDRMLFNLVLAHFDRDKHQIVHAGTGFGTLPSALAMAGYAVAGIEQDPPRFRGAWKVRATLAEAWPGGPGRYQLIEGEYPTVLDGTPWLDPSTVVIFTNCAATWSEELTARIFASFESVGDVLFDARLFGEVRDDPGERDGLIELIRERGLSANPVAESTPGTFYYHLRPNGAT